MRSIWKLFLLKLQEQLASPLALAAFLILPLLFGAFSGYGNVKNQEMDMVLALVDKDQSRESRALAESLQRGGWQIDAVSSQKAQQLLLRQDVDGVLEILPGYEENLGVLKETKLLYTQAEGTMTEVLAREVITAAVLPAYSRLAMSARLEKLYAKEGKTPPANLEGAFEEEIQRLLKANPVVTLQFIGKIQPTVRKTYVVTDFSMEILLLSIYGILGMHRSRRAQVLHCLIGIPGGFAREYLLSLCSLGLLGGLQIAIYTISMAALMGRMEAATPKHMGILFVFLIFVLALGQMLQLIEKSIRLYASLMLLLISAILGGCFFQLPGNLLAAAGQYTPHGWALATLRGYETLPMAVIGGGSLLLLILGYAGQKKQVEQE